jgi:hypothetical protein
MELMALWPATTFRRPATFAAVMPLLASRL